MIQPIYTSVSNADIKPCGKKGHLIKSEPIPLLRDNYLGEYRTELEYRGEYWGEPSYENMTYAKCPNCGYED